MKLLEVVKSDKPGKKLKAVFKDESTGRTRTTHFGAVQKNGKPMDDYLHTGDKDQRARYRTRHRKDLETGDPTRAGFLSYHLCWGDSTSLATNVAAYRKKFHL
jgi:hypothetical protein